MPHWVAIKVGRGVCAGKAVWQTFSACLVPSSEPLPALCATSPTFAKQEWGRKGDGVALL
jgi:hypothetical protein